MSGSLFKPTSDANLEWSLNGIECPFTKALKRDCAKSVYAYVQPFNTALRKVRNQTVYVGGIKGYLYYGKERTIFSIHTEDVDLWSVNYMHAVNLHLISITIH